MLQGDVEIFADVVVFGDGFQKLVGDAVWVSVEEAEPAQVGDAGEGVEEGGEAVFEAEIFAVAGGVLADEGDLFNAAGDACCKGTSRYLQMLSCFAMVSSSLPVMRLG